VIITDRVIQDVRIRWLEPTDAAALRAIDHVIRKGRTSPAGRTTRYTLGTRHVHVLDGVATKAYVTGQKRVRTLSAAAWFEGRERAHWRRR